MTWTLNLQADCKAHYLSVYVGSPAFPEPTPAPEMAGIDPMQVSMRVRCLRTSAVHSKMQSGFCLARAARCPSKFLLSP